MDISALAAIIVFLASVVLSQKIAVNAGSRLDDEMKLRIVDVFPTRNANYNTLVFTMVIVFLTAIYIFPRYLEAITLIYGAAFVIYIFAKMFFNVRKLRELAAPEFYVRSVIISFAVFIGGAVAAAVVFAVGNTGIGN